MSILKLITFLLLTVLPVSVLFRDWKFHDKRTKKHHNITRAIIVFWCIGSIAATYFVWQDSSQIEELIKGKNQLLAKVDKYQNDLTEKEQEIEKLKEKAKKAERGIVDYFLVTGTNRRTHGGNISVDNTLVKVFNQMKELEEQKKYPDLKNICEEQVRKNSNWPTPYLYLGVALSRLGDIEGSIKNLEYFLEIAPTGSSYGYESYRTQAEKLIETLKNR